MDRDTLLDLIPAYALGALDNADERAALEALLATDAEARALLAEYEELSDLLVLAAPLQPAPAHLTDDLRRRLAKPARVLPPPRRVIPLVVWRMGGLVALLGVVFFLAGLIAVLQQPTGPEALFSQLAASENSLRVSVVPAETLTGLQGELVAVGLQAVIRVDNLPVLPADQTYQLWLAAPEMVTSGGLFQSAGADRPTYIILPLTEPVEYYRGFGVSQEAAGGSSFPDRPEGSGVFRVPLA